MSIIGKEDRMSVVSMAADEVDSQASGQDEQIFVSVRLRPLNGKEIARNDVCDWECISNTTIIFKSSMPERSMFPTAYTFDRVFDCDCSTRQVYEEAAKDVALSVVSGINASVFAYGQTSSGKTYTMSGITEYAIADIFDYIDKQQERKFVIKFSAIEIYNEAVRDLLSGDSTPLRVLDDPEKGIIVEKVIEETVTGWSHLKELLSICEAQRQIGETCLNETSSRSHQIIRLTVESSAREPTRAGRLSALTATVNFIDLAGSERASQTLAAGSRLKEGSHINRSLLTLGTVIRKLSKGRNGHIPYRDSKLTRILQNSLGGNARTAIICNMSPARTHVEQSKNTLQFASCAKEVSTHPQLNVLMSDKVLVKQLQKELARLESELKCLGSVSVSSNSAELLREKDTIIEQLEKEIKELTWQRDLAQSRLESLLQSVREDRPLRKIENTESESSEVTNPLRLGIGLAQRNTIKDFEEPSSKQILQIPDNQEDNFLLDDSTPKFFGLDPGRGWEEIAQRNTEDACKEVQCIEVEQSILNTKSEGEAVSFGDKEKTMTGATRDEEVATTEKEEKPSASADNYESLKQKIQELQKTISSLVQCPPPSEGHPSSSQGLTWTRTKSRRSVLMTIPSALWSGEEKENENMPHAASEGDAKVRNLARKDSEDPTYASDAESVKEIEVDRDDTTTVIDFVAGVNKLGRFQSGSEIPDNPAPEASAGMDGPRRSTIDLGAGVHDVRQHHTNWPIKFERYRRKIIELWARCNVSLVHRSYFFLLFKGDPSDNVYMEVELRRLYFLRDTSSSRGNSTEVDSQIPSPTTSLKALYREREMLAKQLQKKFTKKEREQIYLKWSIDLDSKQRSLQLARRLWTDVRDIKHVRDSANLVATLIGFVEPRYAPKELFGLSFLNPLMNQKSSTWKDNMSSLSLL